MVGLYRIIKPILGMFSVNGHHEAITVPEGTIVDLNGKKFNGDRLMEVEFDGRKVLMFTEDLRQGTVPA